MNGERKVKVGKRALYKGYKVLVNSKDSRYYYALYEGGISPDSLPRNLMGEMVNIARGEYLGRIPLNDPDLVFEG